MFKFLHAADIHLDSPLVGLERYDGAPVEALRQATRRALENLVQLALDERVAFVLIAGDLYDRGWRDYATGLHFVAQTGRLRGAGIPLFVIAGNHDAANKMTKVLRFQAKEMLSADQPETRVLEEYDVAIHGQGFAREAIEDDLSEHYPKPIDGCFNIGLLHTCAAGTSDHARYAPCTIEGLRAKGYDYWALGHIHQRAILHRDPYIVFPGNVQGRHIREAGAKGCVLVTVDDGRQLDVAFRPLDVLRWEVCPVNATGAADADDVLGRVRDQLDELLQRSDGLPLAVRVEVQGFCPAHASLHANALRWLNEIRSEALEASGGQIWVEKVKLRTGPPSAAAAADGDGPLAEVRAVLDEWRTNADAFQKLREELSDLARKLPPELQPSDERHEGVNPADPVWLHGLLDQVEPLLLCRLLAGKETP